jgi:hypothetical protein
MTLCGADMKIRFEDRTRWAPLAYIAERDARPVPYRDVPDLMKAIVRETTSVIHRMRNVEPKL